MEALILAIIITYAIKKAAESSHQHWQSSKGANRKASRGQPVRQRAASAARHDTAYWAEQVRGGFPQVRHGLYMGWQAGKTAQLEGWQARERAKAEHAHLRARVTEAVRVQRRRQEEALERIRAAARQPEPDQPAGGADDEQPGEQDMPPAQPEAAAAPAAPLPAQSRQSTEGNTMPGDTTYTQQLSELETIRRETEAEAAAAGRFRSRMAGRLDELQALGLDNNTLSDAAAIDDALQAQEKAAQQTLDAADAAIHGLKQRHGGIKEAVDDAPVDKPADPEFYTD